MHDFKTLAMAHSASCFLNALFREFDGFVISENRITIPVSSEKSIAIPLKKESLLGRHQYSNEFFVVDGGSRTKISFLEMVELLSPMLARKYEESHEKSAIFVGRIKNSIHNIEMALKERASDIEDLYSLPVHFKAAEQGLMIGHNFHPYPKTREGFDDSDFKVYAPEMAGHFSLSWFFVKPAILHNQTAEQFKNKEWLFDLHRSEFFSPMEVPSGYVPFPVHTWQKQHLLKNSVIQNYLSGKEILDAGESDKSWYPTSSLRSVYGPHSAFMLKFSLTLRLTNSIRHLTDVEVVRGLQVYDVMATTKGQEFSTEFPDFKIIFEPGFAALKDSNGKIISESIVVCRENPFQDTLEDKKVENIVLSTLAQDHPLGGETLIQTHVKEYAQTHDISLAKASSHWFKTYLQVAVKPLIVAQAKYGILLGAHQQNMIIAITDHVPTRTYFRDCQGTGYSHLGYSLYHSDVASLNKENGNILDDKGNILFGYYLIVNSTFNVISALAQGDEVSETQLIGLLRDFALELLKEKYPDSSFLEYILHTPQIYQKGNFNCSLQNLNENTTANPLAIYNLITNPLYRSREGAL